MASGIKFDTAIPNCREGVFFPVPFAGPEEILTAAVRAEALGYHAVWAIDFIVPTPDYPIPDTARPDWYEPFVSLAACAMRTERIKLGVGVILVPFRDPVIMAKQVATLDRFRGGRLLLVVGLGLIPTSINQNPCAHFLRPMDMIFHGWSMSLFQAWQQMATISSYDLKIRLDSQLSRMNCQMFSTGFSSGALGGKGSSVMLAGTSSLPVVCHPARSRMSTAWAPDATWDEISSRCHCMALVLQRGRTRPAPTPRWGQMAPKI